MCYWHAAILNKSPASTTINIQHIGPRLYHSNMNCFCLFIINTHLQYSFSTTMWYLNCGATQPQFTRKTTQERKVLSPCIRQTGSSGSGGFLQSTKLSYIWVDNHSHLCSYSLLYPSSSPLAAPTEALDH